MNNNIEHVNNEVSPFPSTIFGVPPCYNLSELSADVAFLGIPYDLGKGPNLHAGEKWGPQALRNQRRLYMYAGHSYPPFCGEEGAQGWFDIDSGEWQMVGVTMADCGDVNFSPEGGEDIPGRIKNTDRITSAVRKILDRGSFPALLGGDHTLTGPAVRAFEKYDPLDIVQFDAHLDWSDSYYGAKITDADCMKRCSEFTFVRNMTHIGHAPYNRVQRGYDYEPYEAAVAYGANIVTAEKVRQMGTKMVLESIPKAKYIYVTIDIDCMDAAFVPGCSAMTPGGLSYLEVRSILKGIPSRGRVVGFDVNDLNPDRDPINRSAKLVDSLILDFLAAVFTSKKLA